MIFGSTCGKLCGDGDRCPTSHALFSLRHYTLLQKPQTATDGPDQVCCMPLADDTKALGRSPRPALSLPAISAHGLTSRALSRKARMPMRPSFLAHTRTPLVAAEENQSLSNCKIMSGPRERGLHTSSR